ncbi:MAG: hypothetical protein DMD38_04260 [Gemmatimonadetes bacterium]|nr:MAG: hypothetical protein AUI86_03320 [Gemmatimonadetes bacterium 13_1_40CM_3_66_12]OLD88777.1 MAG: hypothetical protein AUG85_03850 [Gemmatimonadetes bacterium 13_1_20CM_4_66_11]PYP97697.1 MAG: hypothetical protein DMD38_04260 [Gemmatimonadota bacterium]
MSTTHHAPRTILLFVTLLTTPAAAQDPSGHWRTLHTQHFRVHFRPEYRARAVVAAREAERAYALLSGELHPPRGIIDLTLSDDVDAANGFTTVFPSNRFTIFLVPPVTDPGLQNYDSWDRLVIVHELTHVFHLDRSRGLWKTLQAVFGRAPGLFPNQYQPSWVIEGLATYYESRFTTGGRADGTFHREIVGADAAAGRARSPWDALYFSRWPDGLAPYAYGSRFWDYVSRTAGDSVVPHFIEATSGQLIPFRVGRQLRHAGVPNALTDVWTRSVVAAAPERSGTRSQLIDGRLRFEPVPRIAANGRSLAYVHDDWRGARRLRVIDPATGAVLRSHRVNGQVSYDWLGDTLVVAQLDYTARWTVRSDLWRWSPDGAWTRVTTGARVMEPRTGGGLLSTLKLTPGGEMPSAGAQANDATWGPAVPSPDGRWMVAPRNRHGRWALVRWRAGAPESVEVLAQAASGSVVADPVWSSDDVLFVMDAGGFPQIHRWRAGAGITQVTDEPLGARAPAPLADGRVAFATLGNDGWELRAVAPVALPPRPVTLPAPLAFDSAPPVAMRETGYASWGSLRPHFWIPLGLDAGQAGRFLGAATAGADAVGRYTYVVEALLSGSPARAQGYFFLLSQALGDPTLDFYLSNDWSLTGIDSTGHVVSSEHRQGSIGATVLAHRWRSFVSLRVAAEYEGRRYVSIPDTNLAAICNGCINRDQVGGSATLALGSVVAAPLSVSLQDGATAALLYRRKEEQGTDRWLNEVRARGNFYARLGPRMGFAYPVLALRAAIGALDGPIPDRLSVGGVSQGGVNFGFGEAGATFRTFPVRGYASGAVQGRRAATLTAEYRVPVTLLGRLLGHLPFGADKLAFAVFGDVGDAWNVGEPARLHRLRSIGAELIGDMTVSYDLPLRVRLGVAQPATGHPQVYAAFAADF